MVYTGRIAGPLAYRRTHAIGVSNSTSGERETANESGEVRGATLVAVHRLGHDHVDPVTGYPLNELQGIRKEHRIQALWLRENAQ
jgi:hypothetical protein